MAGLRLWRNQQSGNTPAGGQSAVVRWQPLAWAAYPGTSRTTPREPRFAASADERVGYGSGAAVISFSTTRQRPLEAEILRGLPALDRLDYDHLVSEGLPRGLRLVRRWLRPLTRRQPPFPPPSPKMTMLGTITVYKIGARPPQSPNSQHTCRLSPRPGRPTLLGVAATRRRVYE